ncbi:MAG: hypothetical protein KatS3mg111_2827 [Pirellulaceae bacterium]|nr:MAG: hypothetical protein KatS3mg111_2827 [Pirellulaceae bacterium]
MRISRLELLRYGPFDNQVLEFADDGRGLHCVFGPNEAGKSSALAAVIDFLFGFERQTRANFRYGNSELRIGAEVVWEDGRRLRAVRRKGIKHTLLDPESGKPLDPRWLRESLAGLSPEVFRRRMGIDYDIVREGRVQVQAGKGELGEALFAAGSGLTNLLRLRQDLQQEMDELFKPSGTKPALNAAIAEYKKLREEQAAASLPTDRWASSKRALDEVQRRLDAARAAVRELDAARQHWQRAVDALPLVRRRDELIDRLAAVKHVPLLDGHFSERRREAISRRLLAESQLQEAAERLDKLRAELEQIAVPNKLMAHAEEIRELSQELGAYRQAVQQRTPVRDRLEVLEQEIAGLWQQWQQFNRGESAEPQCVTRAQRERIAELAELRTRYVAEYQQIQQSVDRLRTEACARKNALDALPSPPDTGELVRRINAARQLGDVEVRLDSLRSKLAHLEQQAATESRKLQLKDATLDRLAVLPIPDESIVERFEQSLERLQLQRTQLQQQCTELEKRIAVRESELSTLQGQDALPTVADLQSARQHRDALWKQILLVNHREESFAEDGPVDGEPTEDWTKLGQQFERAMAQADEIADRLWREAGKVAERAGQIAELAGWRTELSKLHEEQCRLDAELRVETERWRRHWQAAGIEPREPRGMRTWLRRYHEVLIKLDQIQEVRAEITAGQQRIEQTRELLAAALQNVGQTLDEAAGLRGWVEQAEAVAEHLEEQRQQRRAGETEWRRVEKDLEREQRRLQHAQSQLDAWETQWRSAVESLNLSPDLSPAEAQAVLETIRELDQRQQATAELRRQLQRNEEVYQRFQRVLAALLQNMGEQAGGNAADTLVIQLRSRLDEAERLVVKRDELQKRIAEQERIQEQARAAWLQAETELHALCEEAGCDRPEELPAVEQQSQTRKELATELRLVEQRLHELAGGGPLEELVADVRPMNAEEARRQLQQVAEQLERERQECDTLHVQLGKLQEVLKAWDGSADGARAAAEAEMVLARIKEHAAQWVRLKLATSLLQRGIQRYREQNQGALLERASRLFQQLTLGSFEHLDVDYESSPQPVLVGVRPSGRRVGVEGMSEGTCDQLYLALRLAAMETYLEEHPPLPLIVDDVLVMFDDRRAEVALEILARIARRTQVIYFTHHEHLIDIARSKLKDEQWHELRLTETAAVAQ